MLPSETRNVFETLFVRACMAFRLPAPEELALLEWLIAAPSANPSTHPSQRLDEVLSSPYAFPDPSTKNALRYVTMPLYSERLWQESRSPDIRPGYVETMSPSLRGYCISSSSRPIVRWSPAHGDRAANIITHEVNHALVPERHPDPGLNESWNRYASYSMTGDPMELEWFVYRR